jgi:hypothetical protein
MHRAVVSTNGIETNGAAGLSKEIRIVKGTRSRRAGIQPARFAIA